MVSICESYHNERNSLLNTRTLNLAILIPYMQHGLLLLRLCHNIERSRTDGNCSYREGRTNSQWHRTLEQPINTLGKSFDDLFTDVRPVALPNNNPGDEAEARAILVRVEGDPVERPEIFTETNGD